MGFRFSVLPLFESECAQLARAGSNEIRSGMPVAAASRSRVRVDGFTLPLFKACDDRLCRAHAPGQFLLCKASIGARPDQPPPVRIRR
jgi:hypothetical protein